MMNSCILRLLFIWMSNNAESICRKESEKLKWPALHAFIIPCGTKSARITRPNTLTGSYIRFLLKAQPFLNFVTRKPKSKLYIEVYRLNTLKYTYLNTLLKITKSKHKQNHIAELNPILTHCYTWSNSNSLFYYIAELYPIKFTYPIFLPAELQYLR